MAEIISRPYSKEGEESYDRVFGKKKYKKCGDHVVCVLESPAACGNCGLMRVNESKRVCTKCGHEACPYCGDWCDIVLYKKEDRGNHVALQEGDEYPILCCDGKCTYAGEHP